MADDWQIGDLALCIKDPCTPKNSTRAGRVYEVERVWTHPDEGQLALDFFGINNGHRDPKIDAFWGHLPARFRKITPPPADEFDREVIELLRREPVPSMKDRI